MQPIKMKMHTQKRNDMTHHKPKITKVNNYVIHHKPKKENKQCYIFQEYLNSMQSYV
jgi:hypothetical protein